MKKNLLILVALLTSATILAQSGGAIMKKCENQLSQAGRGNVHVAYQDKAISQMIYDSTKEQGIPGTTLATAQTPYILRAVGYGATNLTKGNLATAKTLQPIDLISQGYAVVAAVQFYEQGKLDLNDPVGKYLEDVPESWKPVSTLQLIQHNSGIVGYRAQKGFDVSADYRPEQLVETAAALPLAFEPGTDMKQSVMNSLLLTSTIERVGRMPYHDFVKKYQVDYLGLWQTFFGESLAKVKQKDTTAMGNAHRIFKKDRDCTNPLETMAGHVEKDGRLVAAPAVSPTAPKGFSDIQTSAENVSHWDIGLAGNALIEKPENRDIVYKPARLANGKVVPVMAGWQFYNHNELMDIKGDVSGHSAFLSRFTDASEPACVTLLANKEGMDLMNLGWRIAAAFDNAKTSMGVNDNLLHTYEGQFSIDETMGRIEQTLRAMGIPVFAKFDHKKNAEEVGLTFRPNQVAVSGSPKVGTRPVQGNPSISIELSLRISVQEDENDSIWAIFPQMQVMAIGYGLETESVIGKMQELLEKIMVKEASVY